MVDKEPPKAQRREAAMGSDSSALAPTEKGGGGEKGEGGVLWKPQIWPGAREGPRCQCL